MGRVGGHDGDSCGQGTLRGQEMKVDLVRLMGEDFRSLESGPTMLHRASARASWCDCKVFKVELCGHMPDATVSFRRAAGRQLANRVLRVA